MPSGSARRCSDLASRTLGAPVRIDGPISLRLLPQPMLVAGRLDIAAATAGAPSLSAGGVRLQLALAPLLAGRIEARALVLRRPDLRLPGRLDPRTLLARRPSWLGGAAARIEDGRIEAGGVVFRAIDASLAADPLSGDLAASGTASASGNDWAFAVRLTKPGGDGAAGVDVSLTGRGRLRDTALTLSGQLAADGGLQGHGAAHGPDLSLLLPTPPLPFSAEGRVSLADGLAEADDLAVDLAGAPSRGAVALRLAPVLRLDLALAASRLDLDPWLALARQDKPVAAAWASIPVGVDLSAEAGILEGGTLRGLRAAFDVAAGRLSVRELRAVLPGEAALRLSGTVTGQPARRFEGDATLAAPSWPATRDWLASLLPQLDRLPRAAPGALDLSAHVVADPAGIALSRIAGTLDGGRADGALAWRRGGDGAADQVTARLVLQRLDLDPWLAAGLSGPDLDLRIEATQALARGVTLATFRLDLGRHGGALDVRRLQATAGGVRVAAAGKLSADGRLDGGRLTLDAPHLVSLQAFPGLPPLPLPPDSPLLQAALHLSIDASGVRRALSTRLQATLGDLRAEAQPTLDLATGDWSGSIRLRDPSARRLLEASRMLTLAGVSGDAAWLGEGSLSLSADCTGGADALALANLDVTAGSLRTTGALRFGWGAAPSLSGRIDADVLPLPGFAPGFVPGFADAWLLGGAPRGQADVQVQARQMLVGGAALFAPFAADVTLARGRFRLDAARAGVAGGTAQASATLDLAAEPPRLEVRGSLTDAAIGGALFGLPVDIASGRADGKATLAAEGHSMAAMRSALHGEVSARVDAGSLQGVALGALPPDFPADAVTAALQGGVTSFDRADLAARLDHGIATVTEGRITLPAGAITLSGSYDLSQDVADLALTFQPSVASPAAVPPIAPPVIGLRLLGQRGAMERIAQLAGLARWHAAQQQP